MRRLRAGKIILTAIGLLSALRQLGILREREYSHAIDLLVFPEYVSKKKK